MTGPEHYREAELLLAQITDRGEMPTEVVTATCQAAQVHATLALAAATALHGADPSGIDWLEATT